MVHTSIHEISGDMPRDVHPLFIQGKINDLVKKIR